LEHIESWANGMKAEISRDVHGNYWLNRVREHQPNTEISLVMWGLYLFHRWQWRRWQRFLKRRFKRKSMSQPMLASIIEK
jgi:hypothetical protein